VILTLTGFFDTRSRRSRWITLTPDRWASYYSDEASADIGSLVIFGWLCLWRGCAGGGGGWLVGGMGGEGEGSRGWGGGGVVLFSGFGFCFFIVVCVFFFLFDFL